MIAVVTILFVICCLNVIVSIEFQHFSVYLHYQPHIFSEDGTKLRCLQTPPPAVSTGDSASGLVNTAEEEYEECRLRTVKNIRSVRKSELYAILRHSIIPLIEAQLEQFLEDNKRPGPRLLTYVEGNVLGFQDKIDILQEYADDPRVETVCEIGFNAGFSASLWLLNNPKTQFFAFDIFYHNYSGVAISAVHHIFGGRQVLGVAGDSNTSVPNFHTMFPTQKCNIIFIDGGHAKESLRGDIEHMRFLANESFHRVIVDDVDEPSSHLGELNTEYWQFVDEIGQDPRPNDPLLKHIPLADMPVRLGVDGAQEVGVQRDGLHRTARLRHFRHYLVDAVAKPQVSWSVIASPTHLLDTHAEFEIHDRNVTQEDRNHFLYAGRSGITVAEYIL